MEKIMILEGIFSGVLLFPLKKKKINFLVNFIEIYFCQHELKVIVTSHNS